MRLSTNFRRFATWVAFAIGASLSLSAQAYDLRVANRTPFAMQGQVNYAACRADNFAVAPGQTWTTRGRGLCLIRAIHARVIPSAAAPIAPPIASYSSSGTSYPDFIIAQSGGAFRVWSAQELARQAVAAPAAAPVVPTAPPVRWETVAAGKVPPAAAFKGGVQRMGGTSSSEHEKLAVCRGQSNGVHAIGNAAPFWGHGTGWSWTVLKCYIDVGGGSVELDTYEVLIVDPQVAIRNPTSVRWVAAANGELPPGAYDAKVSGTPLYACRGQTAEVDNWVRVGTMRQNGCYMPYGGHARLATTYDVLVADGGAGQQVARGPNEPRLAVEPDRPAWVSGSGENCARIANPCKARLDELRAMGTYKINSVVLPNFSGNEVTTYKKSQGSIWDMRNEYGTYTGATVARSRPYLEVERTDDNIVLFSGPWDFGGTTGTVGPHTMIFALKGGMVPIGSAGAEAQVWEGTATGVGQPVRNSNGWTVPTSSQNIERGMMAEPDTALALTLRPMNAGQTSTFWKGNTQPPVLVKGTNGQFNDYLTASSGNGWLELYKVFPPQGGVNKWQIQFLAVDFWRNRVWELLGQSDQQPNVQDVASLKALAKRVGPSNAWAEAYQLSNASVFSGVNIGAALGRVGGRQVAWTLREEVGSTLRWEELKSDGAQAQRNVAEGMPVGRMLTEVGRTSHSLTLSGSEYGTITIDWLAGSVNAGSTRVGEFLTGASEYVGQRKKLPPPIPPGISPGFQFINKTDWPVMVKISQVGCLYHGVIPPHGTMTRHTGAVWFSVSAAWSTDGKDLTKEQVFTDCVGPVVFTTLGVIATAASGGSAAGVVALGAAAAGTAGAATTAVEFMKAGGSSQGAQDAVAAGIYVVGGALTGGVGAFQVVSKSMLPGTTAAAARAALASGVAAGTGKEALIVLRDESINYALMTGASNYQEAGPQELRTLETWFTGEVSHAGQYAGYPWPWKMKDRVMPRYEITGGPRVDTLKDGSKLIRKGGPLTFVRVQ